MKKITAIILCLVMLLTDMNVFATENESVTVFVTVSMHGEFVKDVDNNILVQAPVTLEGSESYDLNNVFLAFHNRYYDGGTDAGYESQEGEYGAYITKFWGDESEKFSYQINNGEEIVYGLTHPVENGDFIDFSINESYYPDNENYTCFENTNINTTEREVTLTLKSAAYDENFNMYFVPCDGAIILIDGVETAYTTDENGETTVTFDESGTYIISAKKEKEVLENTVTAITIPHCVVTVNLVETDVVLHNIAQRFSGENILYDANMMWLIPDMAIYKELYPETDFFVSDECKLLCVKEIAEIAAETESPGNLAKVIIALRSMGYDAKKITFDDGAQIDAVAKLTDLVDAQAASVTNIYTLPYVIIALGQAEDYATDEQMNYLINYAVEQKSQWQSTTWGTDGATPMILALSRYYNVNEAIKAVVDESVDIVSAYQTEMGDIGNAASTGLAIAAFSALGIDSRTILNAENSLVDGLMSSVTEEKNGFFPMENSFSTEQGFRGLLALKLMEKNSTIYDFFDCPMNEVYVETDKCFVRFDVWPSGAEIEIMNVLPTDNGEYELSLGIYNYNVRKAGYETESGFFEISDEDIANGNKTIEVRLESKSNGGGGGGSYTYPSNEDMKEKPPVTVEQPKVEEEKIFDDVEKTNWYYEAVKYVYENKLMTGTDKGFEPEKEVTRAMLVTVLYRLENSSDIFEDSSFEDVEKGAWYADAVCWAKKNGIVNGITDTIFAPESNVNREQIAVIMHRYAEYKNKTLETIEKLEDFEDSDDISDWAYDSICWAKKNGIINGTSESTISPKDTATRAQIAQVLCNFLKGANK